MLSNTLRVEYSLAVQSQLGPLIPKTLANTLGLSLFQFERVREFESFLSGKVAAATAGAALAKPVPGRFAAGL